MAEVPEASKPQTTIATIRILETDFLRIETSSFVG